MIDDAFNKSVDYYDTWIQKALPCYGELFSVAMENIDEKQKLFKEIYLNLKPGGAFINVDQIKAPSDHFQEFYWSTWLKKVRQTGASEQQIQESIQRRTEFDKDSTMQDQLNWLRNAGFEKVDCLYHHYFVGVFFAQK